MSHISTGDLLREAIKNKTPLGVEAQKYVDSGQLVPDAVVIGLVREYIQKNKTTDFIFDGFPRTIPQAEALETQIRDVGARPITEAFFLEVAHKDLMERLGGRRVCKQCGAVYHIKNNPPQKADICDVCGGEVYQRKDDSDAAISIRLEAYEKSTAPLKDYYKDKQLFVAIDGLGATQDVFSRIKKFLKN